MQNYFIFHQVDIDENCGLFKLPEDTEKFSYPVFGKAFGDKLPEKLVFYMAPEFPGINIPDLVWNAFEYFIVSDKLKKILEVYLEKQQVEYIPCRIINHKGRVGADNYFVINIIGSVDCVDLKNTVASPGMRKGYISDIEKLNLFLDKIPRGMDIFRIKECPSIIIVSETLKKTLENNNITGSVLYGLDQDVELE